jgi:putative alpha-1,2-mannosidase
LEWFFAELYLLQRNYMPGFMQKRFPNGTFAQVDPVACSPKDNTTRACSLQSDNTVGFFESSSWEYSFFVPHDTAQLVTMIGGNVSDSLVPKLLFDQSDTDPG